MVYDLIAAKKKKKKRKKDPKYVHDKYKEILDNQKDKDEGKAKAVAWSIYCKYKNPKSPRCSKKPEEYLTKKAYSSPQEESMYRKRAQLVGSILDQFVSETLLKSYDIIEENSSSKYVEELALYMWTRGQIPHSLVSISSEAKILGSISNEIHRETKPSRLPTKEEKREVYKILRKVFISIYKNSSVKVWAKLYNVIGDLNLTIIQLEILSYDNKVNTPSLYSDLLGIILG